MKNFIRFLDAEFHAGFEKNIFFEFLKVFDSEIKYFSNVDPKFEIILSDFQMQNFMLISKKIMLFYFGDFFL